MTMDFVTGFPKCHAYGQIYDVIFMVIDRLSKERQYISCTEENESTSAKVTTKLFMKHVWSREGLLISMTSDRDFQFVAKMWDLLCKLLGIKTRLLITWHLEINGQSKIANQEMERYLKSYVNYFQDDWVSLLPIAEFAGNANSLISIKIPLFLSSRGYIPQLSFELIDLSANSTRKQLANATAKSLIN